MCTVVLRREPGGVNLLALRDEFSDRAFDEPGRWWPDQPDVVGGRDRAAGGTWCASDAATGTTALLVNRTERFTGTPTRGVLPLLALAQGDRWADAVDHTTMASFNLVLATPSRVTVWIWDAVELRRVDLDDGTHLVTSLGVDADDPKTRRFAPSFVGASAAGWPGLVTGCSPEAGESALVVRRQYPMDGVDREYATVFGQAITASPGSVRIAASRTPWQAGTWRETAWTARDTVVPDAAAPSGEDHVRSAS